MTDIRIVLRAALSCLLLALGPAATVRSQEPWRFIYPEQRRLEIRDPSQLPRARVPDSPPPRTVNDSRPEGRAELLSLDDAIRTALSNSEVVRVLAGVTAVSSGQTVYDPAISNIQVDTARSRFDPRLHVNNNFYRNDVPGAFIAPAGGEDPRFLGNPQHVYDMQMGLSKTGALGGTLGFNVNATPTRNKFSAEDDPPFTSLNPQTPSSTELSYTQPLLQGAGVAVNQAPIVIARIDTERSFFQLKDGLQQSVQGVVQGYWSLVQARVDAWTRRQQVAQGEYAFELAASQREVGLGSAANVAQARSALANFRASLITADANVLQREAALRNLLGLPPSAPTAVVPVTPMLTERVEPKWAEILSLSEQHRPDIIELKLVLEADNQRLLVARNQALPQLNAVGLYTWNGLEGRLPDNTLVRTHPGDFEGWQIGVNFSVPLGLRRERAELRQQELIILRDRANLEQGMHAASHELAESMRNLSQYYEQHLAYSEARKAAWENLEVQMALYREGNTIYLNALQAIVDWGNNVNAETQSLVNYNTELAVLERITGTILETHGVRLAEERFCSIGPLGRFFNDRPYPKAALPGANADRYAAGTEPSEKSLNIQEPPPPGRDKAPANPLRDNGSGR